MRSARALRALTIWFALLAAAPAYAEWHIVPLVGLTFKGNTNAVPVGQVPIGTHPDFGGAISLLGRGILGVEGIGVFTPTFKGDDPVLDAVLKSSRTLAVMGNVVVTTPRRLTEYSLRPYVSAGLGVMRLSITDAANIGQSTNTAGLDIGAGAIGFFTTRTGVRFDFRYYRRLNPGSSQALATDEPQLSFMTLTVGVVIRR